MADLAPRIDARRAGVAYADDYAAWVEHQARLLRERRTAELDFENLIDEVESLSVTVYRELVSALRLVLVHMLKWDFQPTHRTRSWQTSIRNNRAEVSDLLNENPSLRSKLDKVWTKAYFSARGEASGETDLPLRTFPETCPYDWAAITMREHPLPGDDG